MARHRFPISVPLTFIVYRSSFTCFRRFLALQIETGSSLAAIWCHRQILISPIDSAASVLYRWSVKNVRLSCTVQMLLYIFPCALNLAVFLPLKQTFVNVNLTFEMTQSSIFSDRTLCVL